MHNLMNMKKDTFRGVFTNANDLRNGGSINEAIFNLGFNGKQSNYEYVEVFVDNFVLNTKALTNKIYNVRADLYQPNSISGFTGGGASNIIASVVSTNHTGNRTDDLGLSYQNSTAPIQISNIPDKVKVFITNSEDNNVIDLDSNNNFYTLTLRFCAYYK